MLFSLILKLKIFDSFRHCMIKTQTFLTLRSAKIASSTKAHIYLKWQLIFTPQMVCTDDTCTCLTCLVAYVSCSETEGSVWTQQRGEWDRQVALISGRPHHGDTRCIVFSLAHPRTRSHEHTWAQAGWLRTNHLLWRTGAFHSSVVMYGVWLLLATSPHSHKFNTSSYRAPKWVKLQH